MQTAMIDTSIAAYHSIPAAKLHSQHEAIYAIVARSSLPMSLREIKAEYDRLLDANIDVGTVSARVNKLIEQGHLERRAKTRKCVHSGVNIHPVGLPLKQLELV
jgi:hypothetical protein